jgi:hypothetical protein
VSIQYCVEPKPKIEHRRWENKTRFANLERGDTETSGEACGKIQPRAKPERLSLSILLSGAEIVRR